MRILVKHKADLQLLAPKRPAGYVEDVLSHAIEQDDIHYAIAEDAWRVLVKKYRKTPMCNRCDGAHVTCRCPIPEGYDGEWWLDAGGTVGCNCA